MFVKSPSGLEVIDIEDNMKGFPNFLPTCVSEELNW